MSQPRRKKSSVHYRIARSPTLIDKHTVVRTIHIHRSTTGRIGATTTHTAMLVEEATDANILVEEAGLLTQAGFTTETQTDLKDSFTLDPDFSRTDSVVQEQTPADKSPVSFTITFTSAIDHWLVIASTGPYKTGYPTDNLISTNSSDTTA